MYTHIRHQTNQRRQVNHPIPCKIIVTTMTHGTLPPRIWRFAVNTWKKPWGPLGHLDGLQTEHSLCRKTSKDHQDVPNIGATMRQNGLDGLKQIYSASMALVDICRSSCRKGRHAAILTWFIYILFISESHRIHGAGIYANIKGVYWWDPCYHI